MTFEDFKLAKIKYFEKTLTERGFSDRPLTKEEIDLISERLDNHVHCFDNRDNYDDIIGVTIYGSRTETFNIAIECHSCNEVIIDDEILLMEDEE